MNTKYNTIRQVRITSPMSEREEVFNWILKNRYSIRMAGPKSIGPGRVDVTRLVVVAEKKI